MNGSFPGLQGCVKISSDLGSLPVDPDLCCTVIKYGGINASRQKGVHAWDV